METDSLTHATPATISRCGIIYMQPNHYVKPKYLLNTWLRKLPPNLLADAGAMDIENYCNFLLSAAFEVVDRARNKEQLVFPQVDHFILVKSFLRVLDALLVDYKTYGEKMTT